MRSARTPSVCAIRHARLSAVIVLPSLTPALVTTTACILRRSLACSTRVRKERYCSACGVRGEDRLDGGVAAAVRAVLAAVLVADGRLFGARRGRFARFIRLRVVVY